MTKSVYLYKSIAKKYYEAFKGKNRFLVEFENAMPKKATILDLGCGPGEDTKYLIKRNFNVVSIDNSNEMLKIARKNVPNHKFILKDMRRLKCPKENFDGIIAAFSLIHIRKKEVKSLVKKFHVWLKKNGSVYIALQEGVGVKVVKEPFDPSLKMFLNLYTEKDIIGLLSQCGFEIIFIKKAPSKSKHEFKNNKIFIIAKKF